MKRMKKYFRYIHRVKIHLIFLIFITFSILSACVEIEEFNDNPRGNFEALWKIMDEKYCFFSDKNIDWNKVYADYSARIDDKMDREALFYLLNEMLQKLEDGHVNLYSTWDVGRYWKWFEDYPKNYDEEIIENYLGTDYRIATGMKYKALADNIGYISYPSFSSGLSTSSIDYILNSFAICDGIIIDVRNNGGGMLSNATELASRFTNETVLVGYMQHKTGKGHDDFSDRFPKYIDPSGQIRYQKPVIVLTNRKCYSATNEFVSYMRLFPQVTIMGDRTGGGGGLPFSSELPNGWSVRFSACPNFDIDNNSIEFGIDPDTSVYLSETDVQRGIDTLIETARKKLKNNRNPY